MSVLGKELCKLRQHYSSQKSIDEQKKRNQERIDWQERRRSFVQDYRDSHNGELPKYILWTLGTDKGFVPELEWIRLYDSLENARHEESEA